MAPNEELHSEELRVTAAGTEERLAAAREASDPAELDLAFYRACLKEERRLVRETHRDGGGGLEVAVRASAGMDALLRDIFATALRATDAEARSGAEHPVTLIASGGYGRGELNPGSDIDLLFLVPGRSERPSPEVREMVEKISMLLFDLGFKVSHPIRSLKGAVKFANEDHRTKTTLIDARFITGDRKLFGKLEEAFVDECVRGKEKAYLAARSKDISERHKKHGRTVHLQEPNVKESCGGLRDHHNLLWVMWVLEGSRDLGKLVAEGRLTPPAHQEIVEAYDFLMRVRNSLHYCQKGKAGDILTLRLQGQVATDFGYEAEKIVRRSEDFMRDYYRHTRNLYHHSTSLMQAFELQIEGDDTTPVPILKFLPRKKAKAEFFDGFVAKNGLIYPESDRIFEEDSGRMMRLFLHTQRRRLDTSPEVRRLFRLNRHRVDGKFRLNRSNRETFESILERRGEVATILRRMHRLGFLGLYLPEFGKLTDLVQHEFFHRYSADEHTLRCIDALDSLVHSEEPKEQLFRDIFRNLEDPVALYLALLMHDTGRAEEMRHHEDASAILASEMCRRLRITGDRLRLIMFLVDHHLSFWRTATTKNLEDPETISGFATTVRNREWMETLHLFTYVDSRGTNEEAWNDWKATLMQQLHHSTRSYFEDRESFDRRFNRPRQEIRAAVAKALPEGYGEEIEAHFENMPDRYFGHRGATSVARHVKLFHRFFKLVKRDTLESVVPVVGWEARRGEGYTLLEVAGWNRHHLLAKVAGAIAARNLNILSADLFARSDDLVLDIFRICTPDFDPVPAREIARIEKMLGAEFSIGEEEVDFESLIAAQAAPSILEPEPLGFQIPQRLYTFNDPKRDATILEIQAEDRIGLLYDIFTALGKQDAEVLHARISTQAGAAIDRFQLVGTHRGEQITDPGHLEAIETAVAECLAAAGDVAEEE